MAELTSPPGLPAHIRRSICVSTSRPLPPSDLSAATATPVAFQPGRRPARTTAGSGRGLVPAVVVVTTVSLVGSLVSLATGLSATWADAVGPTGRLSVPLPMNVVLVVLALLATGTRRRVALVAAVLLALACATAVVSGFFDGGYAAALVPVERLVQVSLVVALGVLATLAARRAVRLRRG